VAFGVHSAVVVPLTQEGNVFGALVSARREPSGFSRGERDFLGNLAAHVGLAVRQARLHHDLVEAYDDLRQTQRAMMRQERLRALGEMASGIAHDINNAISPIRLYASLIQSETDLSQQAKAHLRIIETTVSDVEETVARMREFYREREEEALWPVDVNQAAQQAIELTRPRWRDVPQERRITVELETDFQDDLPPVIGIEGEIRQAVTNLILNAVDAMPEGGTLSLHTWMGGAAPAHVILEVTDTGIGMDEEAQERCFEPFFSTKGERGTGMGLAMVYGTMQRHGGDVQVESARGEGTTVRLIFPVRRVTEPGALEEAATPPSSLHILCVDDEPLLREALKETLEGEGHTVELADGGESGLEAFRAARQRGEPFDVVITDLGMPHVGGRQVAQTVKEAAPETPVILLTGWGVLLSAANDIPAAVDLTLSKPPRIEALNRALARVTSRD
jgi:signal transduction histidine kinase/CheY-like chemotaxis protein